MPNFFLFFRYKIELLPDQRLIILDFQFNICLERNICDPVVYVFKSQVLPIPLCVMNMEFKTESKFIHVYIQIECHFDRVNQFQLFFYSVHFYVVMLNNYHRFCGRK